MLRNVYQVPDIYLFFLICFISILISMGAIILVQRFIVRRLRFRNNAIIGNVGALISLIYGVLVGLTALYLVNNINYTADAVQREANAMANIYRDSKWLKQPTQDNIKIEIKKYLNNVIKVEWPLMELGNKINHIDDLLINNLSTLIRDYKITNASENLILQDMLQEIKSLYNAREQRIHMISSNLNPEIWIVILIGTILTIGINYLYKMNFKLHVITTGAVALMASSMIYLLVTLDRPFQGEFVIEPAAFQALLNYIEYDNPILNVHIKRT